MKIKYIDSMEKENFIKIENGTEDSDNILLITENRINYTNLIQVHNNYIESINRVFGERANYERMQSED